MREVIAAVGTQANQGEQKAYQTQKNGKEEHMAKVTKKKAPSRVRYEEAHPVISYRTSKEIHERLKALKESDGKSFTDILKLGLGIAERQSKKAVQIRQEGWRAGYEKGYAKAELLYKVTYRCRVCGETMVVTNENEKKAIAGYMEQAGWQHSECRRRI